MPTEYYRKHLIHHGFDRPSCASWRRGVDKRAVPSRPSGNLTSSIASASPITFHFLYVGRMSREKNLDGLIEAFDALLAAATRRAGHRGRRPVPRGIASPQRKGARSSSPASWKAKNWPRRLPAPTRMVFPSTTDTFGNVVLEAQASGLPVIVTDRGGPAEIVRRHDSGIIVDDTVPHGLAEAMERLYLDPSFVPSCASAALRNAAESSWEDVLDDLCDHDDTPAQVDGDFSSSYRSRDPGLAAGVIAMNVP